MPCMCDGLSIHCVDCISALACNFKLYVCFTVNIRINIYKLIIFFLIYKILVYKIF